MRNRTLILFGMEFTALGLAAAALYLACQSENQVADVHCWTLCIAAVVVGALALLGVGLTYGNGEDY